MPSIDLQPAFALWSDCTAATALVSQSSPQRPLDQLSYYVLIVNAFTATTKSGKQANAASKAALKGVSLP